MHDVLRSTTSPEREGKNLQNELNSICFTTYSSSPWGRRLGGEV